MSQSGVFAAADAVELARVTRDGFVESRHSGSAVVLDAEGELLASYGDPLAPVYPRSALKPYLSVAVMTSGVPLRGEDAAISTASHTGTALHVSRVRALLSRAGLDESALQCPAALPSNAEAAAAVLAAGGGPKPVYMGCSGKHAALLLACRQNGWSIHDYLDAAHPLQQRIREVIERLSGERPGFATTDGCGTPLYALSLVALARGLQRMARSSEASPFALHREAGALAQAIRENPTLISGPGEPETIAIERTGVVSKLGFEGVQTMVAPNGIAVALKTLDGSLRPGVPVALSLLAAHGGLEPELARAVISETAQPQWGGSRRLGSVEPVIGLAAAD